MNRIQPFRRMEIITSLQRPPQVKFSDLQEMAGGDSGCCLITTRLHFDLRVDFFRQSDDRVIATFTVQTDNKELSFENVGGLETARLNIFGRITAVSGKRSGIFEDSVMTKHRRPSFRGKGQKVHLSEGRRPNARYVQGRRRRPRRRHGQQRHRQSRLYRPAL